MDTGELKTGQRPIQPPVERTLQAGSFVFKEGERGRKDLYLLREGELLVFTGSKQNPIELARIRPGGVVGEVALFDNRPRSASVMAVGPARLAVIPENILLQVFRAMPAWLFAIVKNLCSRLRRTNEQMGQSQVTDQPAALSAFLQDACTEMPQELVSVLERFSWISRISLAHTQELLQYLLERQWVRLYNDPDTGMRMLALGETDILSSFVSYRQHAKSNRTFAPFTMDDNEIAAALYLTTQTAATHSATHWLENIGHQVPGFTMENWLRFLEWGLLTEQGEGTFEANARKAKTFVTASRSRPAMEKIP